MLHSSEIGQPFQAQYKGIPVLASRVWVDRMFSVRTSRRLGYLGFR
jgi:hypothetical protein